MRDAWSTDAPAAGARVRAAGRADLARLLEMWLELIEHHRRLDARYLAPAAGLRGALERELERGLDGAERRHWVADQDGSPAGFLAAELQGASPGVPGSARIHELFVDPAHRGRGLGRALVAAARGSFERLGIPHVSVRVEMRNTAALRFWRRQGFFERARLLESR